MEIKNELSLFVSMNHKRELSIVLVEIPHSKITVIFYL